MSIPNTPGENGRNPGGTPGMSTGTRNSEGSQSRGHEGLDPLGGEASGSGARPLRDKAARVTEKLGSAADRAREKGTQVREQVGEYTGNNPMTSLALAFVAGVLLTALLRR